MKELTPEGEVLIDTALAVASNAGPGWFDFRNAVAAYRASLEPKPRYRFVEQLYREPVGSLPGYTSGAIIDDQLVLAVAWETCANIMNRADRYEQALRDILVIHSDLSAPVRSEMAGIARRALGDK